jgi:hypothetical protein
MEPRWLTKESMHNDGCSRVNSMGSSLFKMFLSMTYRMKYPWALRVTSSRPNLFIDIFITFSHYVRISNQRH